MRKLTIERRQRTVFYAPTARRCFLTIGAAARREASALIARKYPTEREERDEFGRTTNGGWHWSEDDRLQRVHKRLASRLRSSLSKGAA